MSLVQSSGSIRLLVTIAATFILVAGLKAAGAILSPIALAGVLVIMLAPAVKKLHQRGWPTALATIVVVSVVAVVVIGFLMILSASLSDVRAALPNYIARFEEVKGGVIAALETRGIQVPENPLGRIISQERMVAFVSSVVRGIAGLLGTTLLVVLLACFALIEMPAIRRQFRSAFPDANDRLAKISEVIRGVQSYLIIKSTVSALTGIGVGVWVFLMDIDFALLWGMLAFVLNFIPTVGSIVAAIPAILIALIEQGVGAAIVTTIGYLVINIGISNVIEPYWAGREMGISTVTILVSLVFWGWMWGLVGMLLAVPLTTTLKMILETDEETRWLGLLLSGGHSIATEVYQEESSIV